MWPYVNSESLEPGTQFGRSLDATPQSKITEAPTVKDPDHRVPKHRLKGLDRLKGLRASGCWATGL